MATCFEGFTFEIDFDFKTGAFVILFTERTAGGGELFDLLAGFFAAMCDAPLGK